jgi:hypothetical protein
LDSKPKAYTLFGSKASWPIGIKEAAAYPCIAITEGVPDFLSAFHLALAFKVGKMIVPVCLSGASVSIPKDALPSFSKKRVRIFVHQDEAGKAAAERWTGQLSGIASKVDKFGFSDFLKTSKEPVNDLNDLLSICTDSYRRHAKAINRVMKC